MADTGTAARTLRPIDEAVDLGLELYEAGIRQQLEADHVGDVVAIDVDSSLWAVGADAGEAIERLRAQRPDALNIFCERIGYHGLHSFGGARRRTE